MTIIRISQHKKGVESYLERGVKKGRAEHRDELDIRVPIFGNLAVFQNTNDYVQANKNWQHNYWHITISIPWKYHQISTREFTEMTQEVLGFYFHLYDKKQLAAYAEIHYTKKQTSIDKITLKTVQRLPHVHLIVSKQDLWSDNQLRILPYKKQVAQAFQFWLDEKHNFESHYKQPKQCTIDEDKAVMDEILTVEHARSIIEAYKNWHREFNQPNVAKQSYKLSAFLNNPSWKLYRYANDSLKRKLLKSAQQMRQNQLFEQRQCSKHLGSKYSALQVLKQRLINEAVLSDHKNLILATNKQVEVYKLLKQATQEFALERACFTVIFDKRPQRIIDKRTGASFNAITFAQVHLHMSVFEALKWLQAFRSRPNKEIFEVPEPIMKTKDLEALVLESFERTAEIKSSSSYTYQ